MVYLYIAAAVVLRLVPHPWNVTPLGAMFLFSGGTFQKKLYSLLVPMLALVVSDYAVIHFLYNGRYSWFSPFTWAGFLMVGLIGWTLRKKRTWARVAAASVAGSVTFFLVSNFGVWIAGKLYPLTFDGLLACYIAALPFFRNSLLGDLAYAAFMFGSFHWLRHRSSALATNSR